MSQKNHNLSGVPYYSNHGTPSIRPKPPKELPDYIKESKIRETNALQYVYDFIRANWNEGDRFVVTYEKSRFYGRIGKFKELKYCGLYKMISADWETHKDKILMGVMDFFKSVEKLEENSHEDCKNRGEISS